MIGRVRARPRALCRRWRERLETPALEFRGRQHAGPTVENLHRLRARPQLADEIIGGGFDQQCDEFLEQDAMSVSKKARRRLVGRAAARDHVAGDGPGRAAKADQRDLVGKARANAADRLKDGFEPGKIEALAQSAEVGMRCDRVEARPSSPIQK